MPKPLPLVALNALVAQKFTCAGALHDMAVVMCVSYPSGAVMADIADSFADAYAATLLTGQSGSVFLGNTIVTLLDGTTPTGTFATDKFGVQGGHGTGNPLPLSVAQGVTWQTAVRGKSFRGRSFLPGMTSDMVLSALTRPLVAAQVTGLQTLVANFLTSLGAQTPALQLMVLSRKLGTSRAVTQGRVNTQAVSQRRRYERVAHH